MSRAEEVTGSGNTGSVLITGVYGSGKSSVAAEIAHVLESRGASYALLDLDYLEWFDTDDGSGPTGHEMMLKNLRAVVTNYLDIGIQYFVLAYSVRGEAELSDLKAVLSMPVFVVRLTVPLQEIERRLRTDVTAGRQDDLREASVWITTSRGAGIEDLTVANDRPIRHAVEEILGWLGWDP